MEGTLDPAIEAGGEVLENEICRVAESLAEPAPPSRVARLGRKAARRVLDSWPLAIALLGTVGVLTVLNLAGGGIGAYHPPQLSNAEQLQRLETTARFAAIEARSFLARHGRVPRGPAEVGLSAADDVSFVAAGRADVVVIVRANGREARFDSRDAGQ